MLNDAVCFKEVYIVCGYTDLRSGIDKLVNVLIANGITNIMEPDTLLHILQELRIRSRGTERYSASN